MPPSPQPPNRLIDSTSPYLLQHAHNPVDWFPWGAEALTQAQREDKPILLSIGYSACHWCHVMERESFESTAIAELLNASFISIKVDREERPDIDDIYMAATLALNEGHGGWPMTVLLTPEQRPFFAGTYFPPDDRYGRPGFARLLQHFAQAWSDNRERIEEAAQEISTHLRNHADQSQQAPMSSEVFDGFVQRCKKDFDPRFGGFGGAPKFPPATTLSLLLRCYRHTADDDTLTMVTKTLDGMCEGGIYDQLGGGFARYSVDERWLAPHFEKMLYDNALLTKVYAEAYQVTKSAIYREVVRETLDFTLRELTAAEGGFYSALDADSEGQEGKFYVWDRDEIFAHLDASAAAYFCTYYDVSQAGNWEESNILRRTHSLADAAASLGIDENLLKDSLTASRATLLAARSERVRPGLDDKVLTAWNGLMIGAMARGYGILSESRYLDAARASAQFVLTSLRGGDGRLLRAHRAGTSHIAGYLEDYAYLCEGLLDLFEAGGDPEILRATIELAEQMISDFGDFGGGALFSVAADHEELLVRKRDGNDGAIPNANATAAHTLVRLGRYTNKDSFIQTAKNAMSAYGALASQSPRAFAKTLVALDTWRETSVEVALMGDRATCAPMRQAIDSAYLPNRLFVQVGSSERQSELAALTPLVRGKPFVTGTAATYLCRDFTCDAPIYEAPELESRLQAMSEDNKSRVKAQLA